MSISTAKQFVAVLTKSRLLKPNHLDVVRDAAQKDPDPKALAGRLVKKGLLSHWQARQLLAGHASFFLGEYRLIDSLTSHAGSHVYLADHKTLGRRVVLKRLPRATMDRDDRKKQLLSAIRAAAGFDHKNLARIYNIEQAGDRYYVISQYVEGSDLAAIVAKNGPLAYADAASAVSQAAAGLAEAHRRKAVHGGVRPSNLVRTPEGQVKLVSVATARRYEPSDEPDSGKEAPEILDAAHFQAPELLKPEAEPTAASDIYSLGCTLYFLLTGKPPFADGTAAERATAHARHQPPGILQARPDTPDLLVKACRKMLAKQPEERPASANDVVKMLAELVSAQEQTTAETAAAAAGDPTAEKEKEPAAEIEAATAKPQKSKPGATGAKAAAASTGDSSPDADADADDIPLKTSDATPEDAADDAEESAEEQRKPARESKPSERRPPVKAAPAAAKPAPRRRGPADEDDDEYKLASSKKTSPRETPSKKSAAAAGFAALDTDSPVAKGKSRKAKAEKQADKEEADKKEAEESSDDSALAAAASSGGFMRKNAKWLLIGGGSVAVLLLATAITLPFVLGGPDSGSTDTEVAQTASSQSPNPERSKPAEIPEGPVEDLNTGIDIDGIDLGLDDEPEDSAKPDENAESGDGAKKEGSAEDPKPEGSQPAASEPAAESADNTAKTEDPKPNPDAVKPAAETSEKPPEKTPEKKPEKPPEKKPPQKPPTFRDLPAVANLPPVPASGEAPAEVTLGKIYVRDRAPWIVVLQGGEAVVPNAELSLNRDAAATAGGRAYVAMLTPRGETAIPIARFWHDPKANALKFQWLETAAAATGASQLRLCQLNLDIDGEEKALAFSQPKPTPPIVFDFDKKIDKILIEDTELPDEDLLRLEITGIEGVDTKAYPFQTQPQGAVEPKKQIAVALQRLDRDKNAQPIALVQVNFLTARKGLTISRRIEQPPRRLVPPDPQLSLARQTVEEEFKKVMDQIKKAEGHGAKDKFRPQLDQMEMAFGQIDLFEMFNKKVKIHYRIVLQSGNHKVPLYDSQMAGAAPAAAPAAP